MNNQNSKLNLRDKILLLFLFIGILPGVFPMVTIYIPAIVLSNIGMFGWLMLTLVFDSKSNAILLKKRNLYPIITLVIMFLLSVIFGNTVLGNRYLDLSVMFFGVSVIDYYESNNKLCAIKYLAIMLAPFTLYVWGNTFVQLLTNPWLVRSIKSTGDYTENLISQGIAGYSLIYFVVALAPILLYTFLTSQRKVIKIMGGLLYVFAVVTVIISNYFTALVCLALSSIVMIFIYIFKSRNWLMLITYIGVVLVCLILMDEIYSLVNGFVSNMSGGGRTTQRLSAMEDSFWSGLLEDLKEDRWPTILKSLETFIKNPFFGVSVQDMRYKSIYDEVGGHSHIFDTLAIWGVLIGCFNIKVIFSPFNKKRLEGNIAVLSIPMLITILVLFGFNNAVNSISSIIYLLYPYICEVTVNENNLC